jgi:hypothetical protein
VTVPAEAAALPGGGAPIWLVFGTLDDTIPPPPAIGDTAAVTDRRRRRASDLAAAIRTRFVLRFTIRLFATAAPLAAVLVLLISSYAGGVILLAATILTLRHDHASVRGRAP